MPLDLSPDALLLDGSETVSVTLRRADGATTVVVPGALRRRATTALHDTSGVSLTGEQTVWHLPAASLGAAVPPAPGDTIAAGDVTWAIDVAALETLGTRWRCACTRRP